LQGLCYCCKYVSLRTKKTYLLFTVKDFGDFRISSEDSIVAIFDVITAALLNIFGLLDMLLEALESIETSSSIGPKTEDILTFWYQSFTFKF
jgi:hypothetical protein